MPPPEAFHSSLKRCDLYDNPYNAKIQAHPAIVKQRKAAHLESDTISSAQVRLEKQLLEKFKQNSFDILNGKMQVLSKMGKYGFLAVMLPAYLFFYGIPKWLLSEVGPNSFHFVKKVFANAMSRISTTVSHIAFGALSIIRKLSDPVLNFITTYIQKGREFYLNAKNKWIELAGLSMKAMAKLFNPIRNSYGHFSQQTNHFLQNFSRLMEAINQFRLKIREALIKFPQNVMKHLGSIPDMGKEMLSQLLARVRPVIHFYQNLDKKLSYMAEITKNFTNRVIDGLIKQSLHSAQRLYRKFAQSTTKLLIGFREPIAAWATPKIEKVTGFINGAKEKIGRIREKIETKLQTLYERGNEFSSKLKENPGEVIQQVFSIFPQPVLSLFTPLAAAFNYIKTVPSKFSQRKHSAKEKGKKFKEKFKKQMLRINKKCFSFLRRNLTMIKPLVIHLMRKIAQLLIKILRIAKEMLKGGFFLLRMLLAWMKILLRHGLSLVRETCAAWFPVIR